MEFKVQLICINNNGEKKIEDIVTMKKDSRSIEQIGLSMKDSKEILNMLQETIVEQQVNENVEQNKYCKKCGEKLKLKDNGVITYRTLFGKIYIRSPRYKTCSCSNSNKKSFSPLTKLFKERTSPELSYIQSKFSSLVSYDLCSKLLKDLLPVDSSLNKTSVRNNVVKTSERREKEYNEERYMYIDGCPNIWDNLPKPKGSITVGIDGAYIRNWEDKKKNFEVIVGKSIPTKSKAKYFGLVQSYDKKPKRRLFELLKSQGMQMNQDIYFMSDGESSVRDLQLFLNPKACHILDWFHITMKITVLNQYLLGLMKIDLKEGLLLFITLNSIKCNLWHGKIDKALSYIDDFEWDIYEFEDTYPKFKKFSKLVEEFSTYIVRNQNFICNYSLRYRSGEIISTSFVESTVNRVVNKRFNKKQQMQWSKEGSHLLLQVRSMVLNDELKDCYEKWYPDSNFDNKLEESLAA